MREIKFRAVLFRNYENKSKIYQVEMINFRDNQICLKSFERGNCVGFEKLTDCKLLQFTGLKDKNGKEIYEGDILQYGLCVEVVFYEPTMGRFMTELKKCNDESEIGEISSLSPYYTDNYEVIGNIHENSELLK